MSETIFWYGRLALLGFSAFSFGLVAAAGVFTVFTTVGLVPRYVGETHSAQKMIWYENLIILGTMTGSLVQLFAKQIPIGKWVLGTSVDETLWKMLAGALLAVMGVFYGIFVGTLALSIAEMLDSIPIFTRRIRLEKGISVLIGAIAFGKLCGALLYFAFDLGKRGIF